MILLWFSFENAYGDQVCAQFGILDDNFFEIGRHSVQIPRVHQMKVPVRHFTHSDATLGWNDSKLNRMINSLDSVGVPGVA